MENTLERQKTSPKDFFLNLGAIVLLYIGVGNLLNLLFSIIDKINPDILNYSYGYENNSIRWAIAVLLVFYPLYVYFIKILNKDTEENPEKKKLGIRKWLTYLTLSIAGFAIAWGFILILNGFLGGELTLNFLLKALSAGIILFLIFEYYLMDLKENHFYDKKIFYAATAVVLIGITGGFYIMGSPAKQRIMRFDERRIQDLQTIQWQIVNYWQQKEKIPQELNELNDSISSFTAPTDPETKDAYQYEALSTTTFKLCANFGLDNKNNYPKTIDQNENWQHLNGNYCFDRKIDTELYPPRVIKKYLD